MTSTDTVMRKVDQIVNRGAAPTILDEGYERDRAKGLLTGYADPETPTEQRERAQAAVEELYR